MSFWKVALSYKNKSSSSTFSSPFAGTSYYLITPARKKKKSLLVVFSNTQIRSVAGHSFICLLAMPILIFVNLLLTSLTVLTDGIFGCLCLSIYSHLHFLNAITLYTWQTSCFYLHVNNVMSELGCLFCFVCLLV